MSPRDLAEPPRLSLVSSDDRYGDWEAVFEDNATWVYRTILARVGNQPDAEDLTAEVFLAASHPLRPILDLPFLQSVSIKDAAAVTSVSVANAKVLQHRCVRLATQVKGKDPP
jgi:hypothetical protein